MIEPQSVNFDARYLYRRQGAEAERERIIELLEQIAKEFDRKDELERAIAKLKKLTNSYHSDRQITLSEQGQEGQ